MEAALSEFGALEGEGGWLIQAFLVIFGALLLDFIQRKMLLHLENTLVKTSTPWDDVLIRALRRPLTFLIWLLGITFAAHIIREKTGAPLLELAEPIQSVGVIVCLTWFLTRFIARAEFRYVEKRSEQGKEVDQTMVEAVARLLRVSVWITGILSMLQTLGFSVSHVMAFGGIGGVAVGFAAKDLLANFFGGLMIYLDRPFAPGNWIRSPDREIEGTVESIGWRLTRIRTFDKRPLYVPNSVFANIAVENPSRMSHRRIHETLGVRYEDANKMRIIITEVKRMLREHPEISDDQTLIVNFNKFAPSSLEFFIYAFTKTTNWVRYHEVKEDVLLKVLDIIAAQDAQAAFPTSTVHLADKLQLEPPGLTDPAG